MVDDRCLYYDNDRLRDFRYAGKYAARDNASGIQVVWCHDLYECDKRFIIIMDPLTGKIPANNRRPEDSEYRSPTLSSA